MARDRKVVLITGVSRGMGESLARVLARDGCVVVGCARSADGVARLNEALGPPHDFTPLSVSDDAAVAAWAERLAARDLTPDLLVNNAAIALRTAPLWKIPAVDFRNAIDVNLIGVATVLRHFIPKMLARRTGVLVNVSSGWGREAAPYVSAYVASKWGVEGLTKSLARELPPTMAAVSVHPGIIRTEMLRVAFGQNAENYPTPEEWAEVAAPFLLRIGPADNGQALAVPLSLEIRPGDAH
jgi:NAD(P)-dependent dehydrogenase (short-subunit alcohol dehydrogenase family)